MPDLLREALRSEKWGLPRAGGWRDQDAGLLDRYTAALNIYNAVNAYRYRHADITQFSENYPGTFATIVQIEKLRRE